MELYTKQYKKALDFLLKAMIIQENNFGKTHYITKQTYALLINIYEKLEQKKKADEVRKKMNPN